MFFGPQSFERVGLSEYDNLSETEKERAWRIFKAHEKAAKIFGQKVDASDYRKLLSTLEQKKLRGEPMPWETYR